MQILTGCFFAKSLERSLTFIVLSVAFSSWTFAAKPDIEFNRDIRPILADQCFSCHGPDSNSRKADLRLDLREEVIAHGAILPGKANDSEFIRRILSSDPDEVMPPPDSHKKLTDDQRKMLQAWIDAGAEYQAHWAFIAPTRPVLPEVKQGGWERNPIDRFVLAKLEANGLSPNPQANLNTLIRRACLDITGLPPTPEEIEVVLNDPSPDHYEKYVDRLLDRPTWGEHRARYWMDYARYGDTHGIHFDNYREMYSYRDWVVEAFNQNIPFDQFTIEQLAGDLLPNATRDQQIASGFNRCNITTNEGGIIDEEYAVLYARDRVETTSAVWMGLTTGCAVCHDHKFDPISQREFYQLAAFFNNTTQKVRDGNIRDTPPIVPVPLPEDEANYDKLIAERADVSKKMDARRKAGQKDFNKWLLSSSEIGKSISEVTRQIPSPQAHIPLSDDSARTISAILDGRFYNFPLDKNVTRVAGHVGAQAWTLSDVRPEFGGVGNWEEEQTFSISLWMKPKGDRNSGPILGVVNEKDNYRGWELSLSVNKLVFALTGNSAKEAIKFTSEKPIASDRWQHVAVTYDGKKKAAGFKVYVNGELQRVKVASDTLKGSTQGNSSLRLGSRSKGSLPENFALQDVRLYSSELNRDSLVSIKDLARATYLLSRDKRPKPAMDELTDWYFTNLDAPYQALTQQLAKVDSERSRIEGRGTIAHVMAEKPEPPVAYVLMRGDYDKRGDEVKPLTPSILPQLPDSFPKSRLGLAQWLVMNEHPLTARVTVNRFWQEVFGQGIVSSSGDFGVSGMQPSNQALLDYLAVQFRENHWNVKDLFRMMLTSATYRQSATADTQKRTVDPNNVLMARGPRFRLDGETIRDYALYTSGLMSSRIGGKSVRPYQPTGVWEAVAMPNSDTKRYQEDSGEALYRRSLYTFWKRAAPPASLEIFNAPSREVCTVKRERTNTPLQALVTLNDPQFIEAARHLAQRALKQKTLDEEERLQWLAMTVLARALQDQEVVVAKQGLEKFKQHYQINLPDAEALLSVGKSDRDKELDLVDHATWTMIAHQLLNLDEALNK
jgi:Protein of unknown function (DUF1553)/Protein of unknown function (DUF1549)/Concanavalin A-like lectin/glucanases superfamily/Planctomycete cytochrome C